MRFDNIHDLARGKWPGLLQELGVPAAVLNGKHQPCPMCGGTDRFRFTDHEGSGSYICNQCGSGTGADLAMKLRGMTFADVAKEIRAKVGSVKETYSKAANGGKKDFGPYIEALWKGARPLAHGDPAMTYLQNRGLDIGVAPSQLRYHARVKFTPNGGGAANYHPAMLAQVVSPDASRRTVHITYLTEDGQKANVSPCRKMAPGAIPEGGAVRLAASAETMGIAEGIETALSASQLFGVPVWAATSAPIMLKWQPPKTVKHVLIFGDTDDSFTGQLAAYGLASHLLAKGFGVEVRLPDRAHGGAKGADWNDVLSNGGAS